jgi:hypothetical protein
MTHNKALQATSGLIAMKRIGPLAATSLALALCACPLGQTLRPGDGGMDLWGGELLDDIDLGWAPPIPPPDHEKREDIAPSEVADKLHVGDTAYVMTTWKGTYVFRVYRVDADAFGGLATNKQKYKVLYGSISKLTIRRQKSAGEYIAEYYIGGIGKESILKTGTTKPVGK